MHPDEAYDDMVDKCAHLPKHIWQEVRHLPMPHALYTGENLWQQEKNDQRGRENFVEFLYEIAFVIMLFGMGFFALIIF